MGEGRSIIDSAALAVVVPRDFTLHIKTQESTRSAEGRHYVGANNTIIDIFGEKDPDFYTDGSAMKPLVMTDHRSLRREGRGHW